MTGGDSRPHLAELYRLHAMRATRLAYLLTGDVQLSEDLVQDAFVKLAGRFTDWREPDAFWPYLRATIVNLAKMHFRRRRVERAYLERERQTAHPPENNFDITDTHEVREALMTLSNRERAALVLRFYEDLPEREIAEVLGCRPGTARSLISRGLESLRGYVTQED